MEGEGVVGGELAGAAGACGEVADSIAEGGAGECDVEGGESTKIGICPWERMLVR